MLVADITPGLSLAPTNRVVRLFSGRIDYGPSVPRRAILTGSFRIIVHGKEVKSDS